MHERVYLDPLNDHITSATFEWQRQDVAQKIDHYRKHPFEVKLLFAICCAAPVFFIGIFTGLHYFNYAVIAASFMGLIIFYLYMHSLQRDVMLLLLCEKKDWVLNPEPDYSRAGRLTHLFPDIFDRGDPELRNVDNQIWGTFGHADAFSFWCGVFHYERDEEQHEIKNNYDMMNFTRFFNTDKEFSDKPVFVIELPTVIPVGFSLFSYGLKRDMQTESIDFNNKYRILLHDKGKHAKEHTLRILSPSVIVRLIEFADEYDIDCITFKHNCMVVLFNQPVWEPKYTNFINRVAIDERDMRQYDKLLKDLADLPLEMGKFIK